MSDHDSRGMAPGGVSKAVQDQHIKETANLISARKIEGTPVYNANGDDLGTIHDVMIEKHSGKVAYAVMSFGGFLGIGEKYHPLPWNMLTYDQNKGGYAVNLSAEELRNAPAYSEDELEDFGEHNYGRRITIYYGDLGYPPGGLL